MCIFGWHIPWKLTDTCHGLDSRMPSFVEQVCSYDLSGLALRRHLLHALYGTGYGPDTLAEIVCCLSA